ncbi:TerD-like tellurite resistance protein [Rhizobium phage RHph_TM39]|uniref:TerD-like tellurite resistance protein n=1 Tax=Rhizobium phage RHph_TM30 TaxID=2509764 RepID=A0A7S5R563_9CAUD|nr:TerD-like tellurite resistance protein [Rhizobium phage RHph_TM30]QIG71702.1 TerD-like tellurite resistance protein [Rhizobium phage RHph_TM40]QIG72065.1 TerD-like tellurite resistance protein [Rhizobium phage RHph_TM2_3B]QIG72427.1 TerD-like tellurite resistance protein [Rhizobium phage RHph_TM3_3_6]QIG77205.1 TerD-like tellurite resistance protein [Rhizobium phage RHph_TM39]QIG77518.1 TerD-like tellurite resistance protein [Rhizobium phage RHph_TM21B]
MIVLDLNKDAGIVLDLSKEDPSLETLKIKLDWNPHPVHGASLTDGFDLDIFAYVLNEQGKITSGSDVVFFNNKNFANGAIVLPKDNRTGEGDDDEELLITTSKIPADKKSVAIYVTIHKATERGHHFGMVSGASLQFINADSGKIIAKYDLTANYSGNTAFFGGILSVENGKGKFQSNGEAADADPNQIAQLYV